jgi:hypothetical protein
VRGKRVKTRQVKLGFLDYVRGVQRTHGGDAWLFPLVAPDTGGVKAWSKWFRPLHSRHRHHLKLCRKE